MASVIRARLEGGIEIRRLCDVPAGWEWQGAFGQWHPQRSSSSTDNDFAVGLVACRPPEPKTERVPWTEVPGRFTPSGRKVHHVRRFEDGTVSLHYLVGAPTEHSSYTVEVLKEDA